MKLQNILNLLSYYKDRQNKVNQVLILKPSFIKEEDGIVCKCFTGKYNTFIKLLNNDDILVDCECDSFKYEFSEAIKKDESLLFKEKYPDIIFKNKTKNKGYNHLTGCKHLIKFANFIFHNLNKIRG